MTGQTPHRPSLAAATIAVHGGRPEQTPGAPLSVPPVLASTYVEGGAVGYGRNGNPTWTALEDVVGALEGGRALAFASGMAAVAAVLDLLPDRSVVVAPDVCYSGTSTLVDRLEIHREFVIRRVDIADTGATVAALDGATMLWTESPTNPTLAVADLPTLFAEAREHQVTTCADNTFATPLNQRPLDLGADIVVHSLTKFLAGHSDVVLGAAMTRDDATYERLLEHRTYHGGIPGPAEAWLALRGIRTLHLRMERSQHNAAVLASRLAAHPAVERVCYPGLPDDPGHERALLHMRGFGAVIAIEVRGGPAAADSVCSATQLWVPATSLGGVESTLERRRRWPQESLAVPESLIRLSIGIEDVEDLWDDLAEALTAAG
ncbi:MAG TPA: aminotransferase class I/II-fold pyridoxal phosphate-dependent enzyme [Jiangellaceae bacterium]|nr:aminotransferase class I/II-fold pyridoxal phosphate-dependent enzyme [Jiangellaceae bacterium]